MNARNLETLADYFVERKERGEEGLPTFSVTMHDGLVRRDGLDRRTESALAASSHALVVPGDIAYNMMRMWQGALGLCSERGNISPAYVVMQPRPSIHSGFAAHWFKSKDALDLLKAYSHGITEDRLRLYPDDFLKIPVKFPPLHQQRKIADILDEADQGIATAQELLRRFENRKLGLMQRLLKPFSHTDGETAAVLEER